MADRNTIIDICIHMYLIFLYFKMVPMINCCKSAYFFETLQHSLLLTISTTNMQQMLRSLH